MRRFGPGGNPYRRRAISRLERRRPTPGDPGRRHRPTPATVVELEPEGDDALERLLEMGFRVSEVKRPLALARAEGVATRSAMPPPR